MKKKKLLIARVLYFESGTTFSSLLHVLRKSYLTKLNVQLMLKSLEYGGGT